MSRYHRSPARPDVRHRRARRTEARGRESTREGGDRSLGSFFFSSRRRHTRLQGDWSSDVCSSDLAKEETWVLGQAEGRRSVAQEVLTGQLANEVKRLYLMEYARLWEPFLADIRPIRTASLEQAGEQARLYSSANSSLEQFIRAVARETTLARRPDQQEGGGSGSTSSWLGEKLQRIREEQHQLSRLTGKPLNVGGMLATGTLEADIVDFRFREYRRLATSNGSGPAPITASLQVLNEAAAVIASARQQVIQGGGVPPSLSGTLEKVRSEAKRVPPPLNSMYEALATSTSSFVGSSVRSTLGDRKSVG